MFLPAKYGQKWCLSQKMHNVLKQIFVFQIFFFAILIFWGMVDFVFNHCWIQNRIQQWTGDLRNSGNFFCEICRWRRCIAWMHYKGENTKSIISQKLRIAQNKTHEYKNLIQNSVHFFRYSKKCPKNRLKIVNKINNNSKNKNRKNRKFDFSFDSAHSASIYICIS